jgi:protoheme IX farnesyltransferase
MKDAQVEAVPAPPLDVARGALTGVRQQSNLSDYIALTKPRLNFLVVVTSAAGYYLGSVASINLWDMAQAVVGTALVAGGAAVLNQVYERDTDAMMRRTLARPLPDHRVTAGDATVFGLTLSTAGIALLAFGANTLAALLALATLVVYLVIYTPMKRRSSAATLVGAVPGALPPLIGWAAAHGAVTIGGWTLFAMVFLWQIPHFMAIAWMYRDDYRSAGFPMLPVIEPDGRRTGSHALWFAVALLPVSLAPTFVGLSGWIYFAIALILSSALVILSIRFAATRSETSARRLFFGSITYLPLIWAAMILNH